MQKKQQKPKLVLQTSSEACMLTVFTLGLLMLPMQSGQMLLQPQKHFESQICIAPQVIWSISYFCSMHAEPSSLFVEDNTNT